MEPINALAWVTALVAALVVLVASIAARTGSDARDQFLTRWLETLMPRAERRLARHARVGIGELDGLLRDATVRELQRRLAEDAVVVGIWSGDTLLGPRLRLHIDATMIELSLYRASDDQWLGHRMVPGTLRSLSFVEPVGWQVEIETLDGPIVCSAWRIQVVRREQVGVA